MAHVASLDARRRSPVAALAVGVLGVAIAIAFGFAAGYGTPAALVPAGLVVGVTILAGAAARPFLGFQVLAASAILLAVFVLPSGKGVNAFDLLLPPVLAASILGPARREAIATDAADREGGRGLILAASRRFAWAVAVYFAIIAASLVYMILDGRPRGAGTGGLTLIRECQGIVLFPLGLWWLRDERRIRATITAMLVGGGVFVVVNLVAKLLADVKRSGLGWFMNQPEWPIDDPSGGAVAMLLLIVLLLARQSLRHQTRNLVMIGVALAMIVLTLSRSGLVALTVFTLLSLPRARLTWVVGGAVALAVLLPLVPGHYWDRMTRTLAHEKGAFETYTTVIRVYTWKAAVPMFLDHPVFGVGFMAFGTFSSAYNDLHIVLHPVENYYLEMATGLGLVGVSALTLVIVRLLGLGTIVGRQTPPGTLGHALARYHVPLLVALLVANLVGDFLVGMVGLAQVALWCALLIRAGHAAAGTGGAPSPTPAGVPSPTPAGA